MNEMLRLALTNGVADKVLDGLNQSYRRRSQRLVTALADEPDLRVVHPPRGGYFVWIAFPEWVDTRRLLATCRHRVTFLPGPRCDAVSPPPSDDAVVASFANFARLCFADADEPDLVTGAQRLIEAYRAFREDAHATVEETGMS